MSLAILSNTVRGTVAVGLALLVLPFFLLYYSVLVSYIIVREIWRAHASSEV